MTLNEFKYPLGAVLQHRLQEYRVVGHIRYLDGSHAYVVNVWTMSAAGYNQLHLDATEVELAGMQWSNEQAFVPVPENSDDT